MVEKEKVEPSSRVTFTVTSWRGFSPFSIRSEEHTSELQSHLNLVCRLLLEKKKKYREVIDVFEFLDLPLVEGGCFKRCKQGPAPPCIDERSHVYTQHANTEQRD